MDNYFQAYRSDITAQIEASVAVIPEGWTAELFAEVEAGRISVRRARAIVAEARA